MVACLRLFRSKAVTAVPEAEKPELEADPERVHRQGKEEPEEPFRGVVRGELETPTDRLVLPDWEGREA